MVHLICIVLRVFVCTRGTRRTSFCFVISTGVLAGPLHEVDSSALIVLVFGQRSLLAESIPYVRAIDFTYRPPRADEPWLFEPEK